MSDCHISVELQAILERVFESIDAELTQEDWDAQVDELNRDQDIGSCFYRDPITFQEWDDAQQELNGLRARVAELEARVKHEQTMKEAIHTNRMGDLLHCSPLEVLRGR